MSQKHIIVIGGGPAGVEAAKAAAQAGARVTLISSEMPGGRSGWHSLLPSKVWLTAADTLTLASDALGLAGSRQMSADPQAIVARIKEVKAAWNGRLAAELQAMGVTFVRGTAVFTSPETLILTMPDGATAAQTADHFIVASGSVPIFPPEMKPDGKRVIAPRFASALDHLPASIIVVGGGATGTEFAYLFQQMGLAVTWIVDEQGVLPDFDPEAGQMMAAILTRRGVKLVSGQRAERIDRDDSGVTAVLPDATTYRADMAFLAIGRKPDTEGLNLEAAGLALANGTVAVDGYGRTANPRIYLAGDAAGPPMIANRAMAQAWIAGRHAAGAGVRPFQPEQVVAAIYSEPQVAQVGRVTGDDLAFVRLPFAATLKAVLLPAAEGFVKLAYSAENGRLTGGVAVGPHAADLLSPVAVALYNDMTVSDFGQLFAAHPTISELAFAAARLAA